MSTLSPQPVARAWLGGSNALEQLELALVSSRQRERWKYTKAAPVQALLPNGGSQPQFAELPSGISTRLVSPGQQDAPVEVDPHTSPEAFATLCYAAQVLIIDAESSPTESLTIAHQGHRLPIVLNVAEGVELILNEIGSSHGESQQTLWIQLSANSRLIHSRNSFGGGTHWQYLNAELARDAHYQLHNHAGGAELRRQDIRIVCAGAGARAELHGAAMIAASSHFDQHLTLEHTAPHTTSKQTLHNIAGEAAKVTFNGRIYIHSDCNGVAAELSNKNLSLGRTATINTKPELEIYTDDVKCAHGATVGQIDDNHLFYCASRGIDPDLARNLLSHAFLVTCTAGPLAEQATAQFNAGFSGENQ